MIFTQSRRRLVALGLTAVGLNLLVTGCRPEPVQDDAAIRKSLAERPGSQVAAEAEKSVYRPPVDGRLMPRQMEMYVAVRRREGRIREVALKTSSPPGVPARPGTAGVPSHEEAGALGTADLRAAQELGYNPREYRWVKERVLEAEIAAAEIAMAGKLEAGRRRYLDSLEARARSASDPAERARIERRAAELRRRMDAARHPPDPAAEHNAALLVRFREQLDEVRAAKDQRTGSAPPAGAGHER